MSRVVTLVLAALAGAQHIAPARVVPNDNRVAAGARRGTVLSLGLVARVGEWHPDGDGAPGAPMPAFAEEGGAPRIPGPLVRVPAGTVAEVRVRNTLADTLRVYGLHARQRGGVPDTAPLVLAPGDARAVRFALDVPGTYLYWGTTMRRRIALRTREDAQLSGAIVVDPIGARPRDRVFVISEWSDTVERAGVRPHRVLAVINGRSWPNTERLAYAVGDSVRWRVINASADLHPMHLHGFFFRVTSRGDGTTDSVYASHGGAPAGDLAVTETLLSAGTMSLLWVPERPGNWLFHCHIPEHFAPRGPLGTEPPADAAHDHTRGGMSGLVMGVTVRPAPTERVAAAPPLRERHLRLLVRPNVGSTDTTPFFGYAVHERGPEPPADTGLVGAPTLDLVRGEPVRITVVNRLAEPTGVHWHGIELASYYDGVPGFSGAGDRITPRIAAGDSFDVHFNPPRSGTFIYHTHANELRQQHAGLAGALVVREPGTRRDPATDIPLVITSPTEFALNRKGALLNGSATPAPITMTVGTTYRLRLIQMSVNRAAATVELRRGDTVAVWRPVAKDGADLPGAPRPVQLARTFISIGETQDYEVTPTEPGDLRLEVRYGGALGVAPRGEALRASGPVAPVVIAATLPVRVVAPGSLGNPRAPSPDTLAGVTWMNVDVPGGGRLRAAVARPKGTGPHPVVVVLHGSHGFAREYVSLARDLAHEANVVAVAGCWFTGSAPAGARFVTPIACPDALPMSAATGVDDRWADARSAVDALVQAGRALPGVRADDVALRSARKDVEAVYIDGGQHNGLFGNAAQHDATVRRVAEFLRRQLER